MKAFASEAEMIRVHEGMFGDAGRVCAEAVIKCAAMFGEPLDPLTIRVVLAPIELGPYNRHYGYTVTPKDGFHFVLGNRHICKIAADGSIVLHDGGLDLTTDFVMHELTHHRQAQLNRALGHKRTRGDHRDPGWYGAIAEAAPRYLGVSMPESSWPHQKPKPGRLTEVEATHWPQSFRPLIAAGDPRLPPAHKSSVGD